MCILNSKQDKLMRLKNRINESLIANKRVEMKQLDVAKKKFNGWTCRLRAYEDSWSHARRKRRMAQSREQCPKQARLENLEPENSGNNFTGSQEDHEMESPSTAGPKNPLLECSLMVGEVESKDAGEESNLVKVCVLYEDGYGGKNALETFRQYLINKLGVREYLLNKSRSRSLRKKRRNGKKIITGITD